MTRSHKSTRSRLSNPAIAEGCDVRHIEAAHLSVREVQRVAVDSVLPSPWQPRSCFEHDDAFSALVDNVRLHGLIQPVAVRTLADGTMELIAGERRLRACKRAGHATIPAFIHVGLSDASARAMTITENLARKDLFPLEVARALVALRDARAAGCLPTDVRAIGAAVGRSKSHIAAMLQIGDKVSDDVVAAVRTLHGSEAEQSALRASKALLVAASKQESPEQVAQVLIGVSRRARSCGDNSIAHDDGDADNGAKKNIEQDAGDMNTFAERPAFELAWGANRRLTLSTMEPVNELDRKQAAALLRALAPVLNALHCVAQGKHVRYEHKCAS